jgi:hypothetical protein
LITGSADCEPRPQEAVVITLSDRCEIPVMWHLHESTVI